MAASSYIQFIKLHIPILEWLPAYETKNFRWELVAGITLASFVLPESMAYATLAGVPTYFGIYCCLAGGLIFALFTTSRHIAVGPTSAISLMVGSTVAVLSGGDPARWAAIAGLSALVVAVICFIAFFFRLSSLVNFISDSILLGFNAGAALSLIGVLLFGILKGILLAALMSIILLFRRTSHPVISVLARIPDTNNYSDIHRHKGNILFKGILILRIESSLLYLNAESIHQKFLDLIKIHPGELKGLILDLSACPYMDVGGSNMIMQFTDQLQKKGIHLKIVLALAGVRELLRKQGMEDKIGHIKREDTVEDAVQEFQTRRGHQSKNETS